ncbi:alpha/beta hydrolase [Altererythrobacter xixiisoli]|uniref:Alpha/beta hydrolase n=1 Tax=Croceibacterium xixiisoli TaxID=1476466 RepID=A0A6I4TNI0_9SPHN|nr:alpha/beta hydrolase-fold protein [Croceibacterium xixiisoli]MXO97514.1 alpha/beta hydrolase [Croceibacterium xixiisoli]
MDDADGAMPEGGPYILSGAETHFRRSAITGDVYRIDIAIPTATAPEAGWPVIFLLDAGGCFATGVEAMRRMSRRPDATGVEPAVVVGVALQSADVALRRRDFTSARGDEPGVGGAGDFLALLQGEVLALVAGLAPVDAARLTLFGHSLAGYFTLWVLAHHPASFRAYAAISPSIWWDRDGLMAALGAARLQDRRVMIAIGEWEDDLPPWQQAAPGSDQVRARRAARQMVAQARAMGEYLRGLMGEDRARFELLPEEDHASILSAAIPRMLRLASRD